MSFNIHGNKPLKNWFIDCIKYLSPNIISPLGRSTTRDKYYILPHTIISTLNGDSTISGMSAIDLVKGLGSHKYGWTISIQNTIDNAQFSYVVTWDDVLHGKTNKQYHLWSHQPCPTNHPNVAVVIVNIMQN